ncbi:non-homologous end-joining DNA ligase [uncultured Jatrophihabitans sp.]|uniref:non-homologous end-joining DNA ligase n=1 Tax=uncultured Jatrophihabitans sp. TaxID=1610747 RepID=UPI0035CC1F91
MTDAPLAALQPDERALLHREAMPTRVPAMLATLTEDRFSDPDWIFERKLDGVRCLALRDGRGRVRLLSRTDQDMSRTYPEIADALAAQADTDLVVDGEVVAFDGRRTSFERLQGRIGLTDPDAARASRIRVYYYVFDVLHAGRHDVRELPLLTRKKLLRGLVTFDDPLRFTAHRREAGEEMFRQACERGDEGVVAKRARSRYVGKRSPDWLKFKCVRDQELVIGGWTEPKGSRTEFGALLLGYHDGERLLYAGKVGTGFGAQLLRQVGTQLRALEQPESPFAQRVREAHAHWVRPELVAQIGFTEWTRDGMLRHPRFLGLRTDKHAGDVVRES